MIRLFARPAIRAVALVAAVLWAWSVGAGQVHRLWVAHEVCESHDEVVELHRATSATVEQAPDRDATWALPTAHAEHGCATGAILPYEPPPLVVLATVTRLSWPSADPLAVAEAPRGPPLAYAPKTSPPALA